MFSSLGLAVANDWSLTVTRRKKMSIGLEDNYSQNTDHTNINISVVMVTSLVFTVGFCY